MTFAKIAFFSLLFCVTNILGQANSDRLTNSTDGYDLLKPSGWISEKNADGYAIANPSKTVVIAVKAHGYNDLPSFAAEANLERDGLVLVGEPKQMPGGVVFRTAKPTPKGNIVIDTCVLFSAHGGGVMVVAITDEANSSLALEKSMAIAGSVRFFKTETSQVSSQIRNALAGKHLLYLYTGNGYSERKDIYLCNSGAFFHSTDVGGFTPNNADGSSFGSTSNKHGNWSVAADGKTLILTFDNGNAVRYTLSARQASNEIGLNGNRYFVKTHTACR